MITPLLSGLLLGSGCVEWDGYSAEQLGMPNDSSTTSTQTTETKPSFPHKPGGTLPKPSSTGDSGTTDSGLTTIEPYTCETFEEEGWLYEPETDFRPDCFGVEGFTPTNPLTTLVHYSCCFESYGSTKIITEDGSPISATVTEKKGLLEVAIQSEDTDLTGTHTEIQIFPLMYNEPYIVDANSPLVLTIDCETPSLEECIVGIYR